jgi:uncharacterized membrane protein
MRRFSLGAAFQLRNRRFQGLSGFEGKPFHPPLTDVPVGAYVVAPILDVVALIGRERPWGHDLHVAAGYSLLVGACFSALTILTGFADWWRMRPGSEVRRITNAHMLVMITTTLLVAADLAVRFGGDSRVTNGGVLALSLGVLVLVTLGGAIGGSLVFDKGYKVRARMSPPPQPGGD